MRDEDFYQRVKNTLPCNMDEWTDEQLKSQLLKLKDLKKVNTKEGVDFYKSMILRVAEDRGLQL
tara:strand:- start:2633 stop:2824 length:192 start_codon:yes stop_codon:yes gene_type:complete